MAFRIFGLHGAGNVERDCTSLIAALISEAPIHGPGMMHLAREWVGPKLEVQNLARRPLAAFRVKRRSRAVGGPNPLALPTSLQVIDSAVHPFGVEPHRIGYSKDNKLSATRQ